MLKKGSCARVTETLMKAALFCSATVAEARSQDALPNSHSPDNYWLNVLAFLTVVLGVSSILTTARLKKVNQPILDENIARRRM